ncbi:MAG: hypothetical protein AAGD06_31650, partial [Acidobacteriota bacterium]
MLWGSALWVCVSCSQTAWAEVFPGADEATPARSQYFSWINNTNEGPTEEQTLVNLEFFAWLQSEYGMQLDIYAFDAGTIDGKRWYGSVDSDRFKEQFPNGFEPIYQRAKELGTRLGVWGGPDGFGTTPEEERRRADMMVELCGTYEFALFKFDSVAGQLRDSKQRAFADMMVRCREKSPDLILLNHRLNLGPVGTPHATTFLLGGQETYIDVHLRNRQTAPHHRAGALARTPPEGLTRLTEDHGVCLSSALDSWDDELILQAFNRALILSPQIYGNPWLLRDDEYPKLARIFNLARRYRDILVTGMALPEDRYGPSAISRGDGSTRLITLRNLSWEPVTYRLRLDGEIGLGPVTSDGALEVRRLHPTERILGDFSHGQTVPVEVAPFRSSLIRVTTRRDFGLEGVEYEVVRDVPDRPMEIQLIGRPGTTAEVRLRNAPDGVRATLDGEPVFELASGGPATVDFGGEAWREAPRRVLGRMLPTDVPDDAEALYEATVFSAD